MLVQLSRASTLALCSGRVIRSLTGLRYGLSFERDKDGEACFLALAGRLREILQAGRPHQWTRGAFYAWPERWIRCPGCN